MKKRLTLLVFVFAISTCAFANNIKVQNVALTGQNITGAANTHYAFVKFDLSWENSWRISIGPANWDAAWVFIKYRVNGGDWKHASLNFVNGTTDGHIAPAGSIIKTEKNSTNAPGAGTFIYKAADGNGNVNYQGVQLRWNYGANSVGDNDQVDVHVYAMEMVYVPQGSYQLGGDPSSTVAFGDPYGFYQYPSGSTPYQVNSEAAITIGTANGNLYYNTSNNTINGGDRLGPLPAAYPKGFKAFYCLKYEISQDQWVSFFNTLTDIQKNYRDVTDADRKNSDAVVNRNGVSWINNSGSGQPAYTSLPDVPMNFVTAADALAYLDWAALRPMTELEYEKACRGTLPVVDGELAWGNSNNSAVIYTLSAAGTPAEIVTNPIIGGNSNTYDAPPGSQGPLRCGIFAASAINKTREETGATFYGIMEMTGNLSEQVITAGSPAGRSFSGSHGDGDVSYIGANDEVNWGQLASGYRGGAFNQYSSNGRISDRSWGQAYYAVLGTYKGISSLGCFRGVRTAN